MLKFSIKEPWGGRLQIGEATEQELLHHIFCLSFLKKVDLIPQVNSELISNSSLRAERTQLFSGYAQYLWSGNMLFLHRDQLLML